MDLCSDFIHLIEKSLYFSLFSAAVLNNNLVSSVPCWTWEVPAQRRCLQTHIHTPPHSSADTERRRVINASPFLHISLISDSLCLTMTFVQNTFLYLFTNLRITIICFSVENLLLELCCSKFQLYEILFPGGTGGVAKGAESGAPLKWT